MTGLSHEREAQHYWSLMISSNPVRQTYGVSDMTLADMQEELEVIVARTEWPLMEALGRKALVRSTLLAAQVEKASPRFA